jgi:hypothetical protein
MKKLEGWVEFTYGGQRFRAPRGFGVEYRRRLEREMPDTTVIRSALELIGYTAKPSTIAKWAVIQKVEALAYAANVHARASDNPLPRHPRPVWFPVEPWTGPEYEVLGSLHAGPTEIPGVPR